MTPSFLAPLFLLGAATAAVPILLHLFRRDHEPRVRFAVVRLLRHAPVERSERRHLRQLLLLALRVAALLLLAIAFARPFVRSNAAGAGERVTLVAIDNSSSMSAPATFARAKELARAAVRQAPAGDLVGAIAFADSAQVVAGPSVDRASAVSAVDAATPGFGATAYRSALEAAVSAFGGRAGTVVVVTDLQESGWDAGPAVVPESIQVQVADVGPPPANLAVTAIQTVGDRVIASVYNGGDAPRESRTQLVLDGRPAGEIAIVVGPKVAADVEFQGASRAAAAAVKVDDVSGIQADNVRYAVLDGSHHAGLLVLTDSGALDRDAFYVQQALAVEPIDRHAYRVAGASPAQMSSWDGGRLLAPGAIVLLSTRGLERRGREALATAVRGGVGLLIATGPSVDGEVVGDILGHELRLRVATSVDATPRTLAPADSRHPIFQALQKGGTLGLVSFRRVSQIDGSGCQTVARFTTGETALLECAAGEGRVLVFASDLDNKWNDFPLHASFVPFLQEAARYLTSGRSRVDEYLVGEVPPGVAAVPGIVPFAGPKGAEPSSRPIAVNIDPREASPDRLSADQFQKGVSRSKRSAGGSEVGSNGALQEDRQQLWRLALGLMIGVLAIEGVVASRTT